MYRNKTGLFRNRKSDNRHFEPDEEEVLQGEENDLNRTSLLTWTIKPVVTGVTLDITNNNEVKETSFHIDSEGAQHVNVGKE